MLLTIRSLFAGHPETPPSEANGQTDRTTVATCFVARGHVEAVRRPLEPVWGRGVVVLTVDFGRVERLQGPGAGHNADLDEAIGIRENFLGPFFLQKVTPGYFL